MAAAFRHYGLHAEVIWSPFANAGANWNRLLEYVYYSALPVPVVVPVGDLGGFDGAHWPIIWKITRRPQGTYVHLAGWNPHFSTPNPMPAERFRQIWACHGLPAPFNHAAVLCGTPRARL